MIASSLVFTQVVQEHRWCKSQKDGRVLWMLNSSWAWRLCPQWHADYMPKKPCSVELWALGLYAPVAGILATWHIYLSTWHFFFFFSAIPRPLAGHNKRQTTPARSIQDASCVNKSPICLVTSADFFGLCSLPTLPCFWFLFSLQGSRRIRLGGQ